VRGRIEKIPSSRHCTVRFVYDVTPHVKTNSFRRRLLTDAGLFDGSTTLCNCVFVVNTDLSLNRAEVFGQDIDGLKLISHLVRVCFSRKTSGCCEKGNLQVQASRFGTALDHFSALRGSLAIVIKRTGFFANANNAPSPVG
jgi:hypothetical protein